MVANGRPEITDGERVLGLFLNTLPYRQHLDGGSWLDLVRQTFANEQEMLPWRRYPLAQIQHEQGGQPLFETVFNFIHLHVYQSLDRLNSLRVLEEKNYAQNNFTLVANFSRMLASEEVQLLLECNASLLSPERIEAIAGYYARTLAIMASAPTERYEFQSLLSAYERQQILSEWNATRTNSPQERSLHQLFEEQAERIPEAVAVVSEEARLTYWELNRRANQVAHHLRSLGVAPETRVGLFLERSQELVVGLLAILKAGCAYIPLDPDYPQARLVYIVEDAHVQVLLTRQPLRDRLAAHQAIVVCLDRDWEQIEAEPPTPPVAPLALANLAYVIYTSGSSGQPKGVQITHTNLINVLHAMRQQPGLTAQDVLLAVTSLSFNIAALELFLPLITGACVVLASREASMDGEALLKLLEDQQVTIMQATPSTWRLLLDAGWRGNQRLTILCGGEALPPELARQLLGCCAALWNMYGPTETTIWSAVQRVEDASGTIPIGHPIENTQIYLLNDQLQLVPPGTPGELYIGGDGLSRGYVGRADHTAERFLPNPFSPDAGMRLYRTGDLACYLSDGSLKFLGRVDQQVKMRGYRIELQEIEATLAQHPGVGACVVVAREDPSGTSRLVAYMVPRGYGQGQFTESTPGENDSDATSGSKGAHLTTPLRGTSPGKLIPEVRSFLKERLPEYMLPAMFLLLAALPLTPNGKIDRRALPPPNQDRPELGEAYVAPRTVAEQELARIWMQVLGLERPGVHDNFFELGGNSLLIIRVVARANKAHVPITARQVFQYPTIAELAGAIQLTHMVAEQGPVTGQTFSSPGQRYVLDPSVHHPQYYTLTYAISTSQPLDPAAVKAAVQALYQYHDALRLRLALPEIDQPLEVASPAEEADFWLVDIAGLSEEEIRSIERPRFLRMQKSFDLQHGPLFKAILFAGGFGQASTILLMAHYLVADIESWQVLLGDFLQWYQQLVAQQPILYPPKSTSFQQWTGRLSEYAQSPQAQKEYAYWLAANRSQVTPLPRDYPEGSNTISSSRTLEISLTAAETTTLLQDVVRTYAVQMDALLITSLARTLAAWTGQQNMLIRLFIHGRESLFEDMDVSHTVGAFATDFPVLIDIGADTQTLETALGRVEEQLRQVPHHGVGYGILRSYGQGSETEQLSALPGAEIAVNYIGEGFSAPSQSGFQIQGPFSGHDHDLESDRTFTFQVIGCILEEKFTLQWDYSENLHSPATVERIAQATLQVLRDLIARVTIQASASVDRE